MRTSQQFFHHFMMLYRPFERELNVELQKHQLQRAQWTIIYYLYHFGPTTLVELSQYQGVEKPTVTRTMNWLEELGFVEQVPSQDKREKKMQLTELGNQVYVKVRVTLDHFEEELLKGISEEERYEAIRIMKEIRNKL